MHRSYYHALVCNQSDLTGALFIRDTYILVGLIVLNCLYVITHVSPVLFTDVCL